MVDSIIKRLLEGRERRRVARFSMQYVPVRLEGVSPERKFSIHTLSYDISSRGFRFHGELEAQVGDLIAVHVLSTKKSPSYAGKARIAWLDSRYAPLICCGAEFVEASKAVTWWDSSKHSV